MILQKFRRNNENSEILFWGQLHLNRPLRLHFYSFKVIRRILYVFMLMHPCIYVKKSLSLKLCWLMSLLDEHTRLKTIEYLSKRVYVVCVFVCLLVCLLVGECAHACVCVKKHEI